MNEATLCRALGLDLASPTSPDRLAALASPKRLAALAQAITETTDELDGLSSRLALVARALTETVAAARRIAQLARDEARAQMDTRKLKLLNDRALLSPEVWDEAIREDAGAPSGDRCVNCWSVLPIGGVGWLCAPCELVLDIEGASVASAGGAGPPPLDHSEVTP